MNKLGISLLVSSNREETGSQNAENMTHL